MTGITMSTEIQMSSKCQTNGGVNVYSSAFEKSLKSDSHVSKTITLFGSVKVL